MHMYSKVRAQEDFEKAASKGSLHRILSRLTGSSNQLLPFDEVRERLPVHGQHYLGGQQVEISKIIGSLGRYHDFDRIFLPIQRRTKERWVSIDQAHYESISLPPVELYKIGEIYFVKDGNHRVSVARQRGQQYIDAIVIEIETPIVFTPDTTADDLKLQKKKHLFYEQTNITTLRPDSVIEFSNPDLYDLALEHIEKHRWYLGEETSREVEYYQAVESWFDQVYMPLLLLVQESNLIKDFPGAREADLCLWLMQYQSFLGEALQGKQDAPRDMVITEAAQQLLADYPLPAVKRILTILERTGWLDSLLLRQEQADFFIKTNILEIRPKAEIKTSLSGQYSRLVEHIAAHRWYLGEQRNSEVLYSEALASWYDHVYMPLIEVIREQNILASFPGRTETDLYLWIISHQWILKTQYGEQLSTREVVLQYAQNFSGSNLKRLIKKLLGRKS